MTIHQRYRAPLSGAALRLLPSIATPDSTRAHFICGLTRSLSTTLFAMSMVMFGWTNDASAQEPPRSSSEVRRFDVPAGPLQPALMTFAKQADIQLSFAPALTEGRSTPGLTGDYSAQDGLTQLLSGSGIVPLPTTGGRYVLERASSPPAVSGNQSQTLGPVTVSSPGMEAASTEARDSYAAPVTTVGRTIESVKELPHSVTVVTRDQMDDQQMTTLDSAMRSVTGVTLMRYDASGSHNQYLARGFASDTYQLDNVPLETEAVGAAYADLAMFDRVEVLRGPAGLYSGAGEPGLSINLARKRALPAPQLHAALSLGNWKHRRGEVDLTGPLVESARVRGRLVAVDQRNDTYMDNIWGRRQMVYGTIEVDLSDITTLSIGSYWQTSRSAYARGLPTWPDGTLLDVPRSTTLIASWNRERTSTRDYFAELAHRTRTGARIKFIVRRTMRDSYLLYSDPSSPQPDGLVTQFRSTGFEQRHENTTADLHVDAPLQWGKRTHNLIVGLDWRSTSNRNRIPDIVTGGQMSIYDPNPYGIPEPNFDFLYGFGRFQTRSRGIYGQVRYQATDHLKFFGGGRWSWWEYSGVFSDAPPSQFDAQGEFTPYAAAVYDLTARLSMYASYTQIFKPQSEPTVQGDPIGPRTGTQVELGIKGDSPSGDLQYSAALFRIIDRNRAVQDVENVGFALANGKVRSQGFEVQAQGRLGPRWQLSAGYAYTATHVLEDPEEAGQVFSAITPRHNVNLWARYDVPESVVSGLDLGVGVRAISEFYSLSGDTAIRAAGFGLVALRAGYRINRQVALALNIDNLFDKTYWERVGTLSRNNFFGQPRSVMLTLRANY